METEEEVGEGKRNSGEDCETQGENRKCGSKEIQEARKRENVKEGKWEDSDKKRARRVEENKERRGAKWLQKEGECAVTREREGVRLTEENCGYQREESRTVATKGNEKEDVGDRRERARKRGNNKKSGEMERQFGTELWKEGVAQARNEIKREERR